MQSISYQIEDAARNNPTSRLYVGFQQISNLLPHINRYRKIGEQVERLWLFAYPDIPVPQLEGINFVLLEKGHSLINEWFLVLNNDSLPTALIAKDLSGMTKPSKERTFQGVWEFSPASVAQLERQICEQLKLPESPSYRDDGQIKVDEMVGMFDKMVAKLEQSNQQLIKSEVEKHRLTEMIVHDMKSPLAVTQLRLEILEKSLKQSENKLVDRSLSAVRDSTNSLANMVDNLLQLSLAQDGHLRIFPSLVNCSEFIENIWDSFLLAAKQVGVTLSFIKPDVAPEVHADRDMLTRLLQNLFNNALKYSQPGDNVTIGLEVDEEYVNLFVQDEGPGVPEEKRKVIFEAYEQVGGKKQRPGSGLGLAFCQLVANVHNGRIWVESNPKRGAKFVVGLPKQSSTQS